MSAASVLASAASDKTARHELIHAGAIPALAALMRHEATPVREYALGALLALSLDLAAKQALVAFAPELAAFLLRDGESETASETARRLVLSASELPAFRLQVTKDLVVGSGTPLLRAIFGVACLAPLAAILGENGKGKEWASARRLALAALETVLGDTELSPGDLVFVPPLDPEHLGAPVTFCLETCPGVMDRLLRFLPTRPGEVHDAAEPAMRCLGLLTDVAAGQQELVRLLAKQEVKLTGSQNKRLQAMCSKPTKPDDRQVRAVSIQRASKDAALLAAAPVAEVVLGAGGELLRLQLAEETFRWTGPATELAGTFLLEGASLALACADGTAILGVMQGAFGGGEKARVSFSRDFAEPADVVMVEL